MINIALPCRLFVAMAFLLLVSSCKQSHHSYQTVVLKEYITDSVPFSKYYAVGRINERRDDLKFPSVRIIDSVKIGTVRVQDSSDLPASINNDPAFNSSFKVALIYNAKNKWICFDADNDGNLEEEKLYRVDTFKNSVIIKGVDFYDGRTYRKLDFIAEYGLTILNTDGIFVRPYYRMGIFLVDNTEFKFALCSPFLRAEYDKESAILIVNEADKPFKSSKEFPVNYHLGDTIYFQSKSFRFAEMSRYGDTIRLEELTDNTRHLGSEPGQYAFPMQAAEISNGNTFTIGKNGKYTLIDFWGTWCGPCKKIMPDLKALYRQAAEKNFDIVSVAFDGSLRDVADYVRDENIQWINLFDDRNNSVICKKFKVEAFPTLMLLDENGKIVFREIGDERGIEMARNALLK